MNKKAQVVIIIMWILVILAIMAVGVGHRVSMAIRLTAYQRGGAKALALAEAGINRAIVFLNGKEDDTAYDGLEDIWSTGVDKEGKKMFENIEVKDGSKETFTVQYPYNKEDDAEENNSYLCMEDEERKININEADKDLLQTLLEGCGITEAENTAKNIIFWRGTNTDNTEPPDYSSLGYKNKGKKFENTQELVLVQGINELWADKSEEGSQKLEKLMGLITVYSGSKVNINTCSDEILDILINTALKKISDNNSTIDSSKANQLKEMILEQREKKDFSKIEAIETDLGLDEIPDTDLKDIIAGLRNIADVKSQNFRIISIGKVAASGIERAIECIYDRGNKKIVFWHEN